MFRKPAVRTYERRKVGAHSNSTIASTIIREDVPPDRNIRSKEVSDEESGDDTMDDDPFDTTFDRLLKTAKMPPKPPSPGGDSSYAGSSSDEEKSRDDSQISLPAMVDEPVTKKRRFVKREKAVKKNLTVVTGQIKRVARRPGRTVKVKSVSDENNEPNIEQSAIAGGRKRGGNRAASSRADTVKRRAVAKRTSIASRRGRSPDDDASLTRCSVVLTRLEFPDTSTVSENLPSVLSVNENSAETENVAGPRSREINETSDDRFVTDEGTSAEEFVEKPANSVETSSITGVSKQSALTTNPSLRLTRLRAPQRFSIADKSWINSTPIDRRIGERRKLIKRARLQLSPIDASASTRTRGRLGDVKSARARVASKSPVEAAKSVRAEPASPKNSQPSGKTDLDEKSSEENLSEKSSEKNLDEKSGEENLDEKSSEKNLDEKSSAADLDEKSSAADLDDKSSAADLDEKSSAVDLDEISSATDLDEKSSAADVEEKSSASEPRSPPFDDSEKPGDRSRTETSSIDKEKSKDTTVSSTTSPLKGIAPDSSDPESLHLRYEASTKAESSSENIALSTKTASSVPKTANEASPMAEKTHGDTLKSASTTIEELTKDWSDGESVDLTFDDGNQESSSKNLDRSNENEPSISQSTAPSENTPDVTDTSTSEQISGFREDSINSAPDSSTNASVKIDPDDEWSAVFSSSDTNVDVSVDKNMAKSTTGMSESWRRRTVARPSSQDDGSSSEASTVLGSPVSEDILVEKISTKTSESWRRRTVEQLSSGEDGSSSDDVSGLVIANEDSVDESEAEIADRSNFSEEKSSILEDVNGNESREAREEDSDEGRRYLRKPILLLERLVLPVRKTVGLTVSGKAESKNPETIALRNDSTLDSADDSVDDIKALAPARKSRKVSKVEETNAAHSSDARKSNQDSTTGSVDDRASIAKLGFAKKLRKSSKVEETNAALSSDAMKSHQDSTSVDDRASIVNLGRARKSRKSSKVEETNSALSSDAVKSHQDSTSSSVDYRASIARKSRKSSKVEETNAALSISSSVDDRASIAKSVLARESRRSSKLEETKATLSSDAVKSNQDSIASSVDDRASIAKPVLPRKSRKSSKVEETNAAHSSDDVKSKQDSTSSSVDDRASIANPVLTKKSRKSSKLEIPIAARSSHEMESSQNSTLNLVDDSVPDIETQIPTRKSKRPSKVEKPAKSQSSDKIESIRKLTLSSTDGRVSEIQALPPAKKSPDLAIAETAEPKKSSDSLASTGNSAPSKDGGTKRSLEADEEPEVERKSRSKRRLTTEERRINSHRETHQGLVDPVVLLTRLNDPVRVSLRRRQKYSDMNRQLSAIAENAESSPPPTIEEAHEDNAVAESRRSTLNTRRTSVKLSGEETFSQRTTVSVDSSISSRTMNESRVDEREDKRLFLIPGKSWARSLSILSNVHSQDDVEALAVGKGKRWRQSVANILQMQQGLLQSCVKKNEDDKESRSFYGVRNSTAAWTAGSSQPDTSRMLGAASPERFVRRVSIRVVPDGKSVDRIEDSPFLEAYGITSSQNSQKINERSSSIVPRKTLVYNVQEVAYDEIPRVINSEASRDVVLKQCGQTTSLPFDECYPLSYLKHCRKIGEGVYGEVFLYENGDEKNVIKIIPIEGEMDVNNERQKKFDEILSEIVIAKELHNLRFADSSSTSSFVEVKNIRCVVGRYPRKLIELWKTYDDEKNSENDCPVMFDENQLYIVLELGHGGQDLEAFVFQNASESHALFMQAAVALAVAEEKLDFEHRDLHWGNILISRTEDPHVEYKLRDKAIKLASKGVKISVIDFTLSRMSYQGCSIYNDLSLDEDLFSAQGEYQFEIYRLMRKKVENDWQRFEPYTNVLWLHYTLDKMITAVRYRRKGSKIHNTSIEKLRELYDTILNYKSAFDFVTNCDKATRLQGSRTSVAAVG